MSTPVITDYLLAFVAALAIAACTVPIVRRLALRYGLVEASSARKVHRATIPRVGGVAIVLALFLPLAYLVLCHGPFQARLAEVLCCRRILGLFLGGAVIAAVGFVDDVRGLPAKVKLVAEIVVAVTLWCLEYRIEAVTNPITGQPIALGIFALPITVCWVVGVINAINLIDGLDGLASGVSLIATVTLLVLASTTGNVLTTLTMACFAGALLGFLIYNFHPARIFMGDSGSMFIGFVIATSSMAAGTKASAMVALSVPCIALGLPIIDTFLAIFRRMARKAPIFSADREHIHHKLLDMGLGQRVTVLILYGMSSLFAVLAIVLSTHRGWVGAIVLVAFTTIVLALVRYMGYFDLFATALATARQPASTMTTRIRTSLPLLFTPEPASLHDSLTDFGLACQLQEIEVFPAPSSSQASQPILWKRPPHTVPPHAGCRVSLALRPLTDPEATMRVAWFSQRVQVLPNEELLLQVAADQVFRLIHSGVPFARRKPPVHDLAS